MNNRSLQEWLFDRLDGSRWSGDERYFSAYCPFDTHRKPALLVYADGYKCQSCETYGSLEYLKRRVSKGSLVGGKPTTALKPILPRWSDWQRRYETLEGIAEAAHRVGQDFRGYFKMRRIDKFYDVGYFGRLDGWITFPVFSKDKEIIDIVVRKTSGKGEETAKYVVCPYATDDDRPLYVPNWERVLNAKKLYVVFGIITAWSLEAVGLPVVTGITGKSLNPDLLKDFRKEEIVVIPDYDEDKAGVTLVNNLGLRGRLKLVDYPDDMTDLDDIRVKCGNQALLQAIGA